MGRPVAEAKAVVCRSTSKEENSAKDDLKRSILVCISGIEGYGDDWSQLTRPVMVMSLMDAAQNSASPKIETAKIFSASIERRICGMLVQSLSHWSC